MVPRMGRGRFIWHELLTRDLPAAKAFYGRMFGWRTRQEVLGEFGPYTVVHDGDRESIGMVELHESRQPIRWMPSVEVDSIAAAAKAAVFWGGDIRAGPIEVPRIGEVLMIVDNGGATMTLVRPEPSAPAPPIRMRVGSICHHVLVVRDLERTATFYDRLLGWKLKYVEISAEKKVPIFTLDRQRVASVAIIPKGQEGGGYWVCGIGVKNLPAAHQKAVQLGATSVVPPTRFGKLGSTNLLVDPCGATVSLYEPAPKKK
jgi:predicted enzyme related to lactoylglutathione lyase